MKSDHLILNHIKPLTLRRGRNQKFLVQITDMFGVISISVDDESAFKNNEFEVLVKYLRTHGFKYVMGRYCRIKITY
jgi:hypothetical protein